MPKKNTKMQEGQAVIDHEIARGRGAMESIDRIMSGNPVKGVDLEEIPYFADDLDRFQSYVPKGSKEDHMIEEAKKKLKKIKESKPTYGDE